MMAAWLPQYALPQDVAEHLHQILGRDDLADDLAGAVAVALLVERSEADPEPRALRRELAAVDKAARALEAALGGVSTHARMYLNLPQGLHTDLALTRARAARALKAVPNRKGKQRHGAHMLVQLVADVLHDAGEQVTGTDYGPFVQTVAALLRANPQLSGAENHDATAHALAKAHLRRS